ncbi:MAG: sugar phosphate isomerase/epimerase [Parabacteroides distasonis]|nr:sugar phosphate isomerase/epimerase [Parabacteroides distasonis]
MQNRRDFLKKASLLLAGGLVMPQILSSCGGTAAPSKHIGLQLYSLRDDIKDLGIQKVLEIVSKMGYVNLETAGYSDGKIYGLDPAEFKKICNDLGMKPTSAHLSKYLSDDMAKDLDWWNRAIEAHNTAGMKYMVMPVSPINEKATMDDLKRYFGDYFYQVGLAAAGAGIRFGYHNHDFEFKQIEGQTIYDAMLENSSPDHIMFQMDVYWVMRGGKDPVEYLKKYPNRFPILHIKDETAIGASGKMDYKPIFEQAYANGMKDWYVEVERYDTTPQEDVKKSYDFLNAAEYVK